MVRREEGGRFDGSSHVVFTLLKLLRNGMRVKLEVLRFVSFCLLNYNTTIREGPEKKNFVTNK